MGKKYLVIVKGILQLLSNEIGEDKDTEAFMYVSEKAVLNSPGWTEYRISGMECG